jgi:hypothetical protein
MKTVLRLSVFMFFVGVLCTNGYSQTLSQPKINSAEDYIRVRESIVAISQKLYVLHLKYPNASVHTELYDDGDLKSIKVNGVANIMDANAMRDHIMEIEMLGNAVRKMDQRYIPTTTEIAENSRMKEKEEKQHLASLARSQRQLYEKIPQKL